MTRISALTGLMKIRLSLAVTFSAVTGFLLFENHPGPDILILIAGVFFLSSGAAALNQFTESGPDASMERTKHRPIPDEKINPLVALALSFILLASGTAILMFKGASPVLLGVCTVFLYNLVYTSLKKVTWFAVVPGALVGAIPPVIGFTAAGGNSPDPGIVLFSSFMFLWQLPHFWLIILRYRSDYQKAGFKSLPAGINDRLVKALVFAWVTLTSLLLAIFSVNGLVFNRAISMILIPMNICFIILFHRVLYQAVDLDEMKGVKRAFILINTFSLAVMLLFIANSFLV
jgi:protoheme IX farnesyltransferase